MPAARRQARADRARARGASARPEQKTGSTYQQEVASSQIRVAQRLMRDSSAPLTAIAFEVGCGTPQHFSTLFRRLVGESPSAWRAKLRA
ncbi:MAG: helix-turn-helix transcriptional regulator [Sandaracinaceae bacterium]|nr:helix-turn-helix transcriptional regulator [Sandaracinaceae bacterium]